ncbi:hypothetical protein TrVE_jg12578 [Triparma verrucosa]|uniref:Golgi apparatus membrane protein TVP15 n=2 Tax=Triparma TaxID=722752 RepID=A0A9W7EC19_9STRA|nr:hypothetical protein TrST_g9862 [Triparma strigata]GMI13262.1 hypothetical protein TrVE_jg12578 [Triparma verrucosa]
MSWANQDDNPFSSAPAPAPAAPPPAPTGGGADAPSWLSGGAPAPAPAPAMAPAPVPTPAPIPTGAAPVAPPTPPNVVMTQSAPAGPVPNAVRYLRLINLLTSVGVCVLSFIIILGSMGANADLTKAIMCLYVFCFGIMICCFELQLKAVSQYIAGNFGFFFDAKMRSGFLLFVAMLCFDLGPLGIVCGAALICISAINLYALCKYPDYIQAPALSEEQKNNALQTATRTAASAYINTQLPPQGQTQQPAFTQV